VSAAGEERFLEIVLADPVVGAILERAPALGQTDWWLTAGVLFQTVWNDLTGRPAGTGIRDADFFYFDPDTSWAAEDAVIRRGLLLLRRAGRRRGPAAGLRSPRLPRPLRPGGPAQSPPGAAARRRGQGSPWQQHWPELTVLPWG
jgi:hypothetical protein